MALSRYISIPLITVMQLGAASAAPNPDQAITATTPSPLVLYTVNGPVYAIVGPLGDRTPENFGNNATFGFVVAESGVVLVDPGGSYLGAKAIHKIIQGVTHKPIKYVINTGGQDHRWLGNDYFKGFGAQIIASRAAVEDQRTRLNDIWLRLSTTAGDAAIQHTKDAYADIVFEHEYRFRLDNIDFHIVHPSAAHSPGDSFVWLPQFQTVFSGDIVYTQRLLSMMSFSNSKDWLQAYQQLALLGAKHVVPGHGQPTTMDTADRDTYRYLSVLRHKVSEFIQAGGDISDVSQIDQSSHEYLANYDALKGRNVQKIYQELEFE